MPHPSPRAAGAHIELGRLGLLSHGSSRYIRATDVCLQSNLDLTISLFFTHHPHTLSSISTSTDQAQPTSPTATVTMRFNVLSTLLLVSGLVSAAPSGAEVPGTSPNLSKRDSFDCAGSGMCGSAANCLSSTPLVPIRMHLADSSQSFATAILLSTTFSSATTTSTMAPRGMKTFIVPFISL